MKKTIKKLFALALAAMMLLSLAACGDFFEQTEQADTAKTQLYVYTFDCAYGDEWLYALKARFEAKYADYEGENGKKGVQVIIEKGKNNGRNWEDYLAGNRNEIIFSEWDNYYTLISLGLLTDITDVVTTPLTEFGEDVSIFDKIAEDRQDFYKTLDGKVYGIPYRWSVSGINYDRDVFIEYSLFFAKGGCPSEFSAYTQANNADAVSGSFTDYAYTDGSDEMSAGPDGKYGTYDDGMPATFDEFFHICEEMTGYGITPFCWSGQYRQNYLGRHMSALTAIFNGYENTMNALAYKGTFDNLVQSIDANGKVTLMPPTVINASNAKLLGRNVGKYYSALFFEKIISGKYYTADSYALASTHMDAQRTFLNSKYTSNRIAFLMDGVWWENEAASAFSDLEKRHDNASKYDRNIGLLPIPHPTENDIGKEQVHFESFDCLCYINANIAEEKKDLAFKFYRMAFNEESNREWNVITGTPRALTYTMTESDLAQLSPFGKELYKAATEQTTIYPRANVRWYRENPDFINNDTLDYSSVDASTVWDLAKYYPDDVNIAKLFIDGWDLFLVPDASKLD